MFFIPFIYYAGKRSFIFPSRHVQIKELLRTATRHGCILHVYRSGRYMTTAAAVDDRSGIYLLLLSDAIPHVVCIFLRFLTTRQNYNVPRVHTIALRIILRNNN